VGGRTGVNLITDRAAILGQLRLLGRMKVHHQSISVLADEFRRYNHTRQRTHHRSHQRPYRCNKTAGGKNYGVGPSHSSVRRNGEADMTLYEIRGEILRAPTMNVVVPDHVDVTGKRTQ